MKNEIYTAEKRLELGMDLAETKQCGRCKETKPAIEFSVQQNTDLSYRLTSTCKKCRSTHAVNYQIGKRKSDPLKTYPKSSWTAMQQRVVGGLYSSATSVTANYQHQSYFRHGITCEMTRDEWYAFWAANSEAVLHIISLGGIPSVDRIDSQKNYTKDNIRIISREKNLLLKNLTDENITEEDAISRVKDITKDMRECNSKRYKKSQEKNNEGEII